jgi:hypothetical protein
MILLLQFWPTSPFKAYKWKVLERCPASSCYGASPVLSAQPLIACATAHWFTQRRGRVGCRSPWPSTQSQKAEFCIIRAKVIFALFLRLVRVLTRCLHRIELYATSFTFLMRISSFILAIRAYKKTLKSCRTIVPHSSLARGLPCAYLKNCNS